MLPRFDPQRTRQLRRAGTSTTPSFLANPPRETPVPPVSSSTFSRFEGEFLAASRFLTAVPAALDFYLGEFASLRAGSCVRPPQLGRASCCTSISRLLSRPCWTIDVHSKLNPPQTSKGDRSCQPKSYEFRGVTTSWIYLRLGPTVLHRKFHFVFHPKQCALTTNTSIFYVIYNGHRKCLKKTINFVDTV